MFPLKIINSKILKKHFKKTKTYDYFDWKKCIAHKNFQKSVKIIKLFQKNKNNIQELIEKISYMLFTILKIKLKGYKDIQKYTKTLDYEEFHKFQNLLKISHQNSQKKIYLSIQIINNINKKYIKKELKIIWIDFINISYILTKNN